jgi:hypothetical protein
MANQQPHPGNRNTEHPQMPQSVNSAPSLSQSGDDNAEDGRYSVAEEQNFDQQSDQARRVGQAPEGAADPAGAMAKSLQDEGGEGGEGGKQEKLRQSMDRAVPRAD